MAFRLVQAFDPLPCLLEMLLPLLSFWLQRLLLLERAPHCVLWQSPFFRTCSATCNATLGKCAQGTFWTSTWVLLATCCSMCTGGQRWSYMVFPCLGFCGQPSQILSTSEVSELPIRLLPLNLEPIWPRIILRACYIGLAGQTFNQGVGLTLEIKVFCREGCRSVNRMMFQTSPSADTFLPSMTKLQACGHSYTQ